MNLDILNGSNKESLIATLGSIYEHSPWVAEQAFEQLPVSSLDHLQDIMFEIVQASRPEMRLALIRNHPELAGKEADEGTLTDDSKKEQSSAGLNQCSANELAQIRDLNQKYNQKFSFPFVVAVSGLNKYQIIEAMQRRLQNNADHEFETSINEIGKIAKIRLGALMNG